MSPLVSRDPHHQRILEALAGHLDPKEFEACMADLLRPDLPGLVPVPYGGDGGWDGAFVDGKGRPIPLICTTAADVGRNLRRSLDALKKAEAPPAMVALAASQDLSPEKRSKLVKIATDRGFVLQPAFDRSALADRLYHDSSWTRKLLNLSGQPSAMSIVPISRRPLVDLEPIGREADIEWLRGEAGDRILVGQPGSGKTFLFSHLIRNDWPALFLVNRQDRTAIANAIGDQQPKIVVVDDAHVAIDTLEWLQQHRRISHADFEIVASTWPGAKDRVAEALGGLGTPQIRELEPLTRKEILEVYRQMGLGGHDDLLRSLIDQADNRPGFAVTLAQLALQGDWRAVVDGTVLSRTICAFFSDVTGPKSLQLLACFSVGGRRGLSLQAVSEFLGLSISEVFECAINLSAGGTLIDVGGGALSVVPGALRSALIREVFFPLVGPRLPGTSSLVERAEDLESAVSALLDAKRYGADVPEGPLRELVERVDKPRIWQNLAELDEGNGKWALERYKWLAAQRIAAASEGDAELMRRHLTSSYLSLATKALFGAPEFAISELLLAAEQEHEKGLSIQNAALATLEGWARFRDGDYCKTLFNRRMLVSGVKRFLSDGHDRKAGTLALLSAFGVVLERTKEDPATGSSITWERTLLDAPAIEKLQVLWIDALEILEVLSADLWPKVRSLIEEWIDPESRSHGLRPEAGSQDSIAMASFVKMLFRDSANMSSQSIGMRSALCRLAKSTGVEVDLIEDSDFQLLFPPWTDSVPELGGAADSVSPISAALSSLAVRWEALGSRAVAAKLAQFTREAESLGYGFPRFSGALCEKLAGQVGDPEEWLRSLVDVRASVEQIEPFLEVLKREQLQRWQSWVERLLKEPKYGELVAVSAFTSVHADDDIIDKVLATAPLASRFIETICLQGRVPSGTMIRLLREADWRVQISVAVGEYLSDPMGNVRDELKEVWEEVVLNIDPFIDGNSEALLGTWNSLGVVLTRENDLAFRWCQRRLSAPLRPWILSSLDPLGCAISALGPNQKIALLPLLETTEPGVQRDQIVSLLVGTNPAIFKETLRLPELKRTALRTLRFEASLEWMELAVLAFEAGHDPAEIARASFESDWDDFDLGLVQWFRQKVMFEYFSRLLHEATRRIAQEGLKEAERRILASQRQGRHLALHGIWDQ